MRKSEREKIRKWTHLFTIVAVNELRSSLIWVLLRWIMPGIRYIFFLIWFIDWISIVLHPVWKVSFVKRLHRCRGKKVSTCDHNLDEILSSKIGGSWSCHIFLLKLLSSGTRTDVSNMHPSVANYWNGKGEGQVSVFILFYFICYFLVSSLLLMPPLNSYQCAISVQRKVVLNSFSHKNYQQMWIFISYAIYLGAFEHLLRLNVWQRTFEKKN